MYPFLNMYEPGDYKVVISLFFFLYLCGTLCSVICYFIFSPTVDKYSCGYYIRVTDSTATLNCWSKSESGVVPSQITRAIADAKMHESQVERSLEFGGKVGQDGPKCRVELGSAPVEAPSVSAVSGHLYGWQAPDEPNVDDPELPRSHSVERREGVVVHADEVLNFSFVVPEREAYVQVAAGEEIHGANPNEEQGFGQEIIQRFAAT